MIQRVVDRATLADVGPVVLATSDDPSDDPVAAYCREHGIECFRGSLSDLLDRYYHAALPRRPDAVMRLTGDCPLLDPAVIRRVADLYATDAYDYVSNFFPPTFPDGLDAEIFSFAGLERAYREAELPSEREHIAPYFEKRPTEFRLGNISHAQDLSTLRWTVDEERDLAFVRAVYASLGERPFGMREVLDLLKEQPALREINTGIRRNAGHASALEADRVFLQKQ